MTPAQRQAAFRQRRDAKLAACVEVITEANNSLYGSQGFFLSTNGGEPDKYHLAQPIEDMKAYSGKQWRRAEAYKKALEDIVAIGLRPIEHGNAVEYERNRAVALASKALDRPAQHLDRNGDPT